LARDDDPLISNVLRRLFGRLGRRISGGRPGELLADGAHDFLGDLRTPKERMLGSQLTANRPARFANGADNAVERGIGTFDDRLQAVTRGAVLLQVLRSPKPRMSRGLNRPAASVRWLGTAGRPAAGRLSRRAGTALVDAVAKLR
jgi:hypothetical protein